MRVARVALGAVLLVVVASAALAGVWMLRQAGGGGMAIRVEFQDARGLAPDDHVIYGDSVVGRVEDVATFNGKSVVVARIAADQSVLVRQNSRFWIHSKLGSAILLFDTPKAGGAAVESGHTFTGLAEPPDPDPALAPAAVPRKLSARPGWLVEFRATLELKAGADLTETQQRKVTGVIAGVRADGELLVLAPSWPVEYSGELVGESYRVELIGGATHVADILATRLPFVVLRVPATQYTGSAAPFWPDALADGQGLLLTDFEGNAFTAVHSDEEVRLRARTGLGLVALVDGTNVAGFTLPAVGLPEGVYWVPLNGAGTAIEEAAAKLLGD